MGTMLDDTFMDPNEPVPGEEEETPGEAAGAPEPEPAASVAPEPARTPISRRKKTAQAQEEILGTVKALKETIEQDRESFRERQERLERENAELRGQVTGWMSRPQESRQERKDEGPDPKKLLQEADEALDRRDYRTWSEKRHQAAVAESVQQMRSQMPQPQQAQPQTSPILIGIAAQYPDVMSNRVALTAAQAHDSVLAAQGIPEGPERWRKAFEEGKRYLGQQNGGQQRTTFSSKSREVLGAPGGNGRGAGSGAGKGEPGVTLSKAELDMAKKFKMSPQEYAQHLVAMHPDRLENS